MEDEIDIIYEVFDNPRPMVMNEEVLSLSSRAAGAV